jgi:hypothetical protein
MQTNHFRGTTLYEQSNSITAENERYNFKAYFPAFTDGWETDVNIKYLRYAEVVLMKAEALTNWNQTPAAIMS